MFNKSFVSIYFLDSKVFVIELSANRKTVRNFATAEIPQDVIKRGKVGDINALSEIVKTLWSKMGLTEKSVNIVIPEFSTFTKFLKFPNLNLHELGEAVNWQAGEFLPFGSENMNIDWKIVGKPKVGEGYEVLAVAIPTDILMGYVKAAEKANLFPFYVGTPSLSLTNLTIKDDYGVLIIYSIFGETIIVCSENGKILGTSALKDASPSEITETAERMLSHFDNLVVKKIYVGGQIDENFIKTVKEKIPKEISPLALRLENITNDKIQEFLIPIAVQMDKLDEPSDPYTLNLLPSYLVQKYRKAKSRMEVWSITLTITLFVWVSFIIVLTSFLVINGQIVAIKRQNEGNIEIENQRSAYQKEASQINETSTKVLKIKSTYIMPETVFNFIERSKTGGINITNYNMDLDKGTVELSGVSPTRVALVDFKKNLEKVPNVKSVEVPINSFEKESNLEFLLSFQYGEGIREINKDINNIDN